MLSQRQLLCVSAGCAIIATSHAFFRMPAWAGVGQRPRAVGAAMPFAAHGSTPVRPNILGRLQMSAAPDVGMPAVLNTDAELQAVKSQLLQLAAATERGTLATAPQKEDVETLVARMQELTPFDQPMKAEDMAGKWALVYSGTQTYRSSPFFASFQVLVGNEAANRAFSIAGAIPYTRIGQVRQLIDIDSKELVSRVDMWVWPKRLFNGVIETKARIMNDDIGERLDLMVESTGVRDSTLGRVSKRIESFRLPLDRLFERLFDKIPRVVQETAYLDNELRISRDPDGGLFIYVRDF